MAYTDDGKQKLQLQRRFENEDELAKADALRLLVQHPYGRKYLWWLLQIGKVGMQPFATDPYVSAFNSGALNVGQQILAHLTEIAPDGYLQMMKENSDERHRRNTELAAADASGADSGDEPSGSESAEPAS